VDSSLASEDQHVGEGLDTSSTIYKAIMSSDIVRLSLSSHKTLTGWWIVCFMCDVLVTVVLLSGS